MDHFMDHGLHGRYDGAAISINHVSWHTEYWKMGLCHGGAPVYFHWQYAAKNQEELFYWCENAVGIEQRYGVEQNPSSGRQMLCFGRFPDADQCSCGLWESNVCHDDDGSSIYLRYTHGDELYLVSARSKRNKRIMEKDTSGIGAWGIFAV